MDYDELCKLDQEIDAIFQKWYLGKINNNVLFLIKLPPSRIQYKAEFWALFVKYSVKPQ